MSTPTHTHARAHKRHAHTHVHTKDTHTETLRCTLPVDMPSFVCLSATKNMIEGSSERRSAEGRGGEAERGGLICTDGWSEHMLCSVSLCVWETVITVKERDRQRGKGGLSEEETRLSKLLCCRGMVIIIYCTIVLITFLNRFLNRRQHTRAVGMIIYITVLISSVRHYLWCKHSLSHNYAWSYIRCVCRCVAPSQWSS